MDKDNSNKKIADAKEARLELARERVLEAVLAKPTVAPREWVKLPFGGCLLKSHVIGVVPRALEGAWAVEVLMPDSNVFIWPGANRAEVDKWVAAIERQLGARDA